MVVSFSCVIDKCALMELLKNKLEDFLEIIKKFMNGLSFWLYSKKMSMLIQDGYGYEKTLRFIIQIISLIL